MLNFVAKHSKSLFVQNNQIMHLLNAPNGNIYLSTAIFVTTSIFIHSFRPFFALIVCISFMLNYLLSDLRLSS